jgi:putative membrane protein
MMPPVSTRMTGPPGGGRFDEAGDATRRTHLANERTFLAWWRTGLTCLAVGFGAGKIVPSVSKQTEWPYAVLGAGFGLLGLGFIVYAYRRQRDVWAAIERGEFVRPDDRLLVAMTVAGVVLGVLLTVLVVVET